MVYQGQVKNGVVVFESVPPPDGTVVRVEPVQEPPPSDEVSIWDKMKDFAGRAPDLPLDAAHNHDHYLYGRPRK